MTHPKYGDRYSCFQCGTKFYTMGKPKAECPKCGADQKKAPKKPSGPKPPRAPLPVADEFEAEEETPLDEDEVAGEFPVVKGEEDEGERFDPERDHLSIDSLPEDEF